MQEESAVIDRTGLQVLVEALGARGYQVVGPTVREDAIVYDEIHTVEDLPAGWTDEQDGGTYRLRPRNDGALFGYAVGPHSWKKYLFPPRTLLWKAQRTADGFDVDVPMPEGGPYAFLGVRGCELAAIQVQDRVFLGAHTDPTYAARRQDAFIVAVNCSTPAGTCFCVSMGTGPRAGPGFDLALTEVIEDNHSSFVVEVGSERGAAVLTELPHRQAEHGDLCAGEAVVDEAAGQMGRAMDTGGIKELLYSNYEHSRWDDVAERCLACGNCTLVCPTCFCSTVEDTSDLTNHNTERHRVWDSCFTLDFSAAATASDRRRARAIASG